MVSSNLLYAAGRGIPHSLFFSSPSAEKTFLCESFYFNIPISQFTHDFSRVRPGRDPAPPIFLTCLRKFDGVGDLSNGSPRRKLDLDHQGSFPGLPVIQSLGKSQDRLDAGIRSFE